MVLMLLALLAQVPASEAESLVRDLGDELIEVRERAQVKLFALGAPGIPALRRALSSPDAEVRLRAALLLEVVERTDRERAHDGEQMKALLQGRLVPDAEQAPESGVTKGARFHVQVTSFERGWIVSTRATNYLACRLDQGPGQGQLSFDVAGITDADGKERVVERCGRCSPAKVYVKAPAGPLKMRLSGHQVWFSRYDLEFDNPRESQRKRVGDYSIEVAWPTLRITSERDFPEKWITSMGESFKCTLKEGIGLNSEIRGMMFG
jgi:hypothetical protein